MLHSWQRKIPLATHSSFKISGLASLATIASYIHIKFIGSDQTPTFTRVVTAATNPPHCQFGRIVTINWGTHIWGMCFCWYILSPNQNWHICLWLQSVFSKISSCHVSDCFFHMFLFPLHPIWLVVYLPLWKTWVRQLGWFSIPNWMETGKSFKIPWCQTTNQPLRHHNF